MSQTIDLSGLVDKIGLGFAEHAYARDADDRFAAENYAALKDEKVFSAQIPTEPGGGGAGHGDMCRFIRALAGHCSSTALALSMHQHLVAAAVFNYRNDRPGWKVLEKVAADEAVLISTGANDWLGSNGSVHRVDGGYLVTAKKPFASGSPAGSILITSAP